MRKEQQKEGQDWAVVLAAGDGLRLKSITTDEQGVSVPKQFCRLVDRRTLLRMALERAWRIFPPERVVVVVAGQHRRWWADEINGVPPENVLIQPANRGTANGILFPLLWLHQRDPDGRLAIFPSDHHIAREEIAQTAFRNALEEVAKDPRHLVLLGITPDTADTGYGWIVPQKRVHDGVPDVAAFVEKPDLDGALRLMRQGGVWNSFMFASCVKTLLGLYDWALPELLLRFMRALPERSGRWTAEGLSDVYGRLPSCDFSRDLLQRAVGRLKVLTVPPCGWTDLGTPERLAQCLTRPDTAGAKTVFAKRAMAYA